MTKRKKQIQQEELLRLVSIHFNITGFEKFEYCTNHEKIDIFLVLTMYIFLLTVRLIKYTKQLDFIDGKKKKEITDKYTFFFNFINK